MKKKLISFLLVNYLACSAQENDSLKKQVQCDESLLKKGALVGGALIVVSASCYYSKNKWTSIAWASKKYLKNQLELLKLDLSLKLDDLSRDLCGINKKLSCLERMATKEDVQVLADDLKNLQKSIEAMRAENYQSVSKILDNLEELKNK